MSITDELRTWVTDANTAVVVDGCSISVGTMTYGCKKALLAIADRIDAEHEAKVSYWQGACYEDGYKEGLEDNKDATAERGWVKLPVDADGEVIHIGDRVENNERVARIVITDGSCEPSVYVEKLPNVLHEHFCNEISHYHEPTVEDVLREFVERWHDTHHDDIPALFAEYAARLRLRSDAE